MEPDRTTKRVTPSDMDCNVLLQHGLERVLAMPRLKNFKSVLTDPKSQILFDWKSIEYKLENRIYSNFDGFLVDINRMEELVSKKPLFRRPKQRMIEDFLGYIRVNVTLIKSCAECFVNELIDTGDGWFMEACSKPHLVVMVQFQNCAYVPAKVMNFDERNVFVRLFGELTVAKVPYDNRMIKLYKKSDLSGRKPRYVIKAIEAANRYIENIIKRFGAYNYGESETTTLTAQYLQNHLIQLTAPSVHIAASLSSEAPPISSVAVGDAKRIKLENRYSDDAGGFDNVDSMERHFGDTIIDIEDSSAETVMQPITASGPNTSVHSRRSSVMIQQQEREQEQFDPPKLRPSSRCEIVNQDLELNFLKNEIEKMKSDHQLEISTLNKTYNEIMKGLRRDHGEELARIVHETKSKQWCAECWKEAKLYCCWQTSYCDDLCQRKHWSAHKAKCVNEQLLERDN